MTHEHLGLQHTDGLQSDAHHDDDGRAADGQAGDPGDPLHDDGENGHDAQEDGAEEGQTGQHAAQVLSRGTAGTEAGHEAAVLLQVVGHLHGVELDGSVEVAEREDQQEVDDRVNGAGRVEELQEVVPAGPLHPGGRHEHADGGGDHGDGLREDDGQHAAEVDLDGDEGGLAAVHLPAHHALGVLDGDLALCVVHEDHEHHQQQHAHDDEHTDGGVHGGQVGLGLLGPAGGIGEVVPHTGEQGPDQGGAPGHDTGKEDDGDAVAHTVLGDLLTQPHQEDGAGGEGQHNDDARPDAGVFQELVALDEGVVAKALQQADGQSGIPGDGLDLLLALLAAILGQPLQSRDGDGQKLDDDGGVDIGLDG